MNNFGERLRIALKASGYTQYKITKELNLSKNAITNYVNGRVPKAEILYSIAKMLNVSMEWLLTGSESKVNNVEVSCNKNLIEPYQNSIPKIHIETLGHRISKLRTDHNLTQRALMDLLEFDNLSKYEKDLREPKLEVLIKLSDYFNVTLDWLITGKESFITENGSNSNLTVEEFNIIKLYRYLIEKEKNKIEGDC